MESPVKSQIYKMEMVSTLNIKTMEIAAIKEFLKRVSENKNKENV